MSAQIKDIQLNETEIRLQSEIAKKFPRNVKQCIQNVEEMALITQDIAESCIYSIPRGGKTIQGPSIRLAEIFASEWGNIFMGSHIKSSNGKLITATAWCWDFEKNLSVISEATRVTTTKDGSPFSLDMQTVAGAAARSIALRDAIFKVIPRVYLDVMVNKCMKAGLGDIKTKKSFVEKRKQIFSRFQSLGIPVQRIFSFFGKTSIEEFKLDDLEKLIGVGTAITEGHVKASEAFSGAENSSPVVQTLSNLEGKLIELNRS